VYRQPYITACEPIVHLAVFLVAYSLEYSEYLQGSLWHDFAGDWDTSYLLLNKQTGLELLLSLSSSSYSLQMLIPSTSTRIQARGLRGTYPLWMFFFWPSNSLFQTARGSGDTLSECPLWKAHITREFFRAPHGFTHESTRTTLVSTRQYLGATRRLPSSIMICSGAWRTKVLGVA
jgi:hypothetical protein